MATTLGALNPFRYRSYVYDEETSLYYLRSRYYNPDWGRFINADSVLGKPGQLLGHNVFAYCGNNPENLVDPSGNQGYAEARARYHHADGNNANTRLAVSSAFAIAIVALAGILLDTKTNTTSIAAPAPFVQSSIVARPQVIAKTDTRVLEDVEASEESTEALYYLAWVNKSDEYLHISDNGMGYFEAVGYLKSVDTLTRLKKTYKDELAWGVYTRYGSDAKLLALSFGNTEHAKPKVHGLGFYWHFHAKPHVFHIWFGSPIE